MVHTRSCDSRVRRRPIKRLNSSNRKVLARPNRCVVPPPKRKLLKKLLELNERNLPCQSEDLVNGKTKVANGGDLLPRRCTSASPLERRDSRDLTDLKRDRSKHPNCVAICIREIGPNWDTLKPMTHGITTVIRQTEGQTGLCDDGLG